MGTKVDTLRQSVGRSGQIIYGNFTIFHDNKRSGLFWTAVDFGGTWTSFQRMLARWLVETNPREIIVFSMDFGHFALSLIHI